MHWRSTVGNVRTAVLALGCTLAAALAVGCGSSDDGGSGSGAREITAWTLESQPDRMAAQERILRGFTERTGVRVKLRGIEEDQLRTLVSSAAAGGTLPDVILALPLSYVHSMAAQRLSDPEAAEAIVDKLGRETFAERALDLVSPEGTALAVPSDAYGQLIFYRRDLFRRAGLQPPTTFEALETAAAKLHSGDVAGIALATTPNDTFTQESFEEFALANGCQLVDESDALRLDDPRCQRAADFYAKLARDYSVKGNQDVDTTRATYFAGRSAMVVWSSFLLDELASLREDAKPTCPECRRDPSFLVRNTGIVTRLAGPDGSEPAQYGDVTAFEVMADAHEASGELVEYLMSEAYLDWLAIAPEGKIPVRLGTPEHPREYIDAWAKLEFGVDTKRRIDAVLDRETIEAVQQSAAEFDRWGFGHSPRGGQLVGVALGELPMTGALAEVIAGDTSAADALEQAQEQYGRLEASLR
jgi:multiple sugar transport system substrate-binding protein